MENLELILESLLFSSSDALSADDFVAITKKPKNDIKKALQQIEDFYSKQNRSFQLVQTASGYTFRTKQEFSFWIQKNKLVKKQYLSKFALETLAVIAYKQPITKQAINNTRKVDSTSTIYSLLGKKLIRITGRSDEIGKPLLYATSKKFLDVLGLKKLSDIPHLND